MGHATFADGVIENVGSENGCNHDQYPVPFADAVIFQQCIEEEQTDHQVEDGGDIDEDRVEFGKTIRRISNHQGEPVGHEEKRGFGNGGTAIVLVDGFAV